MLADANSVDLGGYFESFGNGNTPRHIFWNMQYQVDQISEILGLG